VTLPRGQAGRIAEVLELGRRARGDDTFQEHRWVTRDVAHLDAVAQDLSRSDEWLHELAAKPFEEISSRLGLGKPGPDVLGGIGSNLALAPVSREIAGAAWVCEIIGIGVGMAFGLHPLAISCTKSLVHGGINDGLTAAIKSAFRGPDAIMVSRGPPSAAGAGSTRSAA
jgi:hypothetical protein